MGGTAGKASGGDAWLVRFCASTACEVQLTALHPDGLSRSGAASATAFTTSRRVSDQRRAASFTVHPDGLERWVSRSETDREKRWPLRSWRGLAKGCTSRASGFFAELIGLKDRKAEFINDPLNHPAGLGSGRRKLQRSDRRKAGSVHRGSGGRNQRAPPACEVLRLA